jgi:hypothetical protein
VPVSCAEAGSQETERLELQRIEGAQNLGSVEACARAEVVGVGLDELAEAARANIREGLRMDAPAVDAAEPRTFEPEIEAQPEGP